MVAHAFRPEGRILRVDQREGKQVRVQDKTKDAGGVTSKDHRVGDEP